jgi:hypothetical protein
MGDLGAMEEGSADRYSRGRGVGYQTRPRDRGTVRTRPVANVMFRWWRPGADRLLRRTSNPAPRPHSFGSRLRGCASPTPTTSSSRARRQTTAFDLTPSRAGSTLAPAFRSESPPSPEVRMDLFRRKSITDLQAEALTDHSLKRALGALNREEMLSASGTGIFVLTGTVAALNAGPAVVLSFVRQGGRSSRPVLLGVRPRRPDGRKRLHPATRRWGIDRVDHRWRSSSTRSCPTVATGWSGYVVVPERHRINVPCTLVRAAPVQCATGPRRSRSSISRRCSSSRSSRRYS